MSQWLAEDWVRGLLSISVSLVIALIVNKWVMKLLLFVSGRTRTQVDDLVIEHFRRPIVISILLFGVAGAVEVAPVSEWIRFHLHGTLQTIAILVWSNATLGGMTKVMAAIAKRGEKGALLNPRTVPVFDIAGKLTILLLAAYFTFLAWDFDVTGWLASAGVIGIALGFAAKDTLANLFAGIFILADAPYKLGDTIQLDEGTRGVVTDIGMRSTRLLTRDEIEVTLPNALIANGRIVNESGGPAVKSRLRVPVSVAYGSDIDQVREVLLSAVEGVQNVCARPAPRARFMQMGDSALIFSLDVFIDTPTVRDDVIDALNTTVYDALNEAKLSIPFPQRDVHIVSGDSSA